MTCVYVQINAILTELGIDHVADQQVGDGGYSIRGLSGGERRRVSIAVQVLSAPRKSMDMRCYVAHVV